MEACNASYYRKHTNVQLCVSGMPKYNTSWHFLRLYHTIQHPWSIRYCLFIPCYKTIDLEKTIHYNNGLKRHASSLFISSNSMLFLDTEVKLGYISQLLWSADHVLVVSYFCVHVLI